MGKVRVSSVLFYILIILAVVGIIALIVLIASVVNNGSLKVVIFGNSTSIFSNKTLVKYGECTVDADCTQCGADNARCPTYFVCKNRVCVEKQYNNNLGYECQTDADCEALCGLAPCPPYVCVNNVCVLKSQSNNLGYECQTDADCPFGKTCLVYACPGFACEPNGTNCDTNCKPYSRCG